MGVWRAAESSVAVAASDGDGNRAVYGTGAAAVRVAAALYALAALAGLGAAAGAKSGVLGVRAYMALGAIAFDALLLSAGALLQARRARHTLRILRGSRRSPPPHPPTPHGSRSVRSAPTTRSVRCDLGREGSPVETNADAR